MKYLVNSNAIIDVTKPPYNVDNTGKTDCTKIICQILDDILINQVNALKNTYDRLMELSNNKTEDAYIGIESGRVEDGNVQIVFPEYEPESKIIYFPKGTYLISDTITYTLENLKQFWYWDLHYYENNRNIHFLGENKENTIIRLADNSLGFEDGKEKPVISFIKNELAERSQEFTNVAFMNAVKDLTIDCGSGNEGAIGIKYSSSNCGFIDNVNIKSQGSKIGIYMTNSSQATISNIKISGFDYGFDAAYTLLVSLNNIDFSGTKKAGVYTNDSILILDNIYSANTPTMKFRPSAKEETGYGRYYIKDSSITIDGDYPQNTVYFEKNKTEEEEIPQNFRSTAPDDWACVDDFGAVGDGITDSTKAIQKAMNSGKSVIIFGKGRYLINAKIKIPATVKTIDFMFCSLANGIRLVGGEYDSAFEISETSTDLLFIENLSAWEQFRGHMRLIKHAALRDTVISNIHLMTASLYFNTIEGSKVYFNNCFLTTGTYTPNAWIPGKGFTAIYNRIIPCEFHGQKVYARILNLERANCAILNDNSDIIIDGFRTEGSGTALRAVNGGTTKLNIFNAALGLKGAENTVLDINDSSLELSGSLFYGFDTNSEYEILLRDNLKNESKEIIWNDIQKNKDIHFALIEYYYNKK